MFVYIDEAGDSGFKFDKHSSAFFVIGMVVFNDDQDAIDCRERISLLRKELNIPGNYEFHFKRNPVTIKEKFFEAVSPYNFFYYGIIVNKSKLNGPGFRYKKSFYKYLCSLLFENAKDKLSNAKVILDHSGNDEFKSELKRYLKDKFNCNGACRIKNVEMKHSHKDNLIQLADYIASGIYRYEVKQKDLESNFLQIISHRKMHIQIWPK